MTISYKQRALAEFLRLSEMLGIGGIKPETHRMLDMLFTPWGDSRIPDRPLYPSSVTDDHSPYEFSTAFSKEHADLRILIEALGSEDSEPSLEDNQLAALELIGALKQSFDLDFARFDLIRDLFFVPRPTGVFTAWFSLVCGPDGAPDLKIYLNPQTQGRTLAFELVCEALDRLGFHDAENWLSKAGSRGTWLDEVSYFALDLKRSESARVKVYFRHHQASVAELEAAFSTAKNYQDGDVSEFVSVLFDASQLDTRQRRFESKPVGSCFSFTSTQTQPQYATLYLPVAHYLTNDALVSERMHKLMRKWELPANFYMAAIQAFANRPLESGAGLHTYAAFRRDASGHRITSYLSPEIFSVERTTSIRRSRAAGQVTSDAKRDLQD